MPDQVQDVWVAAYGRSFEHQEHAEEAALCCSRGQLHLHALPKPPEETMEHHFFECPFAKQCWSKVGLTWPGGTNRLAILHGGRESWRRPLFMDIFLLAAWSLWMERNNQHFSGIPHSFVAWLARFKHLLGLVIHNCPEKVHPFLSDFIVSLDR